MVVDRAFDFFLIVKETSIKLKPIIVPTIAITRVIVKWRLLNPCPTDSGWHGGKCNSDIPPQSPKFPSNENPDALLNTPRDGTLPSKWLKDRSNWYKDAMFSKLSGI